MLRLAWYGDDFTGASDTLATLAAAGLRAVLFPRVPTPAQVERAGPLDALGVAGTARALDPVAMQAEIAPVARLFAELDAAVTHYKCCSTFDSAAQVGNLALGLAALRSGRHAPWVPIVGGQPSLGRYCLFSELYASASAGGEVHRIDGHPTMSRHPVPPMHEADLRLHLADQGLARVAGIDYRALGSLDDGLLDALLQACLAQTPDAVLFDVARHEDLARIGRLLWREAERQPLLVLGASSVAQALIARWPGLDASKAMPLQVPVAPSGEPVFLLAGSLSPVTAAQMQVAAGAYERMEFDAAQVVDSPATLQDLAAACAERLRAGISVLARPISVPGAPSAPAQALARACGHLLSQVLAQAPRVRRVGVAGGDTSSFALRALSPWALRWCGSLAPGVPLLRLACDDPALDGIELMLKGGQMGPPDVFLRLLRGQSPAPA